MLACLNSVFKGSNRLFMFDLNNHQSKFGHLYVAVKSCLIQCAQDYEMLKEEGSIAIDNAKRRASEEKEEIIDTTGFMLDSPDSCSSLSESSRQSSTQEILEKAEFSEEEWKDIIHNHKVLARVFLSDLLTIVGKYFIYFEPWFEWCSAVSCSNNMSGVMKDINKTCKPLDLKKYHKVQNSGVFYA